MVVGIGDEGSIVFFFFNRYTLEVAEELSLHSKELICKLVFPFSFTFSEWDGNKRFDKTKNTSHRNRGKTISVALFGKSLTLSG